MDKINWIQKLSSRKFWAVLIATIGAVAAAFGLSEGSVEQITSIIGAFATLIVYILVEGNIDAHRVEEAEKETDIAQNTNAIGLCTPDSDD